MSSLDRKAEENRASFLNTRCRLQRLKDAKFFAGWVKDLTPDRLQVRLSTKTSLVQGDEFNIEIHGTDRSAVFQDSLSAQEGDILTFDVPQSIRFLPAREKARLAVEGVTGICFYQGVETEFTVNDVSLQGCGLLLAVPITRGAQLELQVDCPQGHVACSGEVRYCKPDTEIPGTYRVGMLLNSMGRLEAARWAKMFEFYVAA